MKYLILALFLTGCIRSYPAYQEKVSQVARYSPGVCIIKIKQDVEEWDDVTPKFDDLRQIIKVGKKNYLNRWTTAGQTFYESNIDIDLADDSNYFKVVNCPKGLFN